MLNAEKLLNATLRAEQEALDGDPEIVEMQMDAFRELMTANRKIVKIQSRK